MSKDTDKYIVICDNTIYLTKSLLAQKAGLSPTRLGLVIRDFGDAGDGAIQLCKTPHGQVYLVRLARELVKEHGLIAYEHTDGKYELTLEAFYAIKMLELHTMLAASMQEEGYHKNTVAAIIGNIEGIVN